MVSVVTGTRVCPENNETIFTISSNFIRPPVLLPRNNFIPIYFIVGISCKEKQKRKKNGVCPHREKILSWLLRHRHVQQLTVLWHLQNGWDLVQLGVEHTVPAGYSSFHSRFCSLSLPQSHLSLKRRIFFFI